MEDEQIYLIFERQRKSGADIYAQGNDEAEKKKKFACFPRLMSERENNEDNIIQSL